MKTTSQPRPKFHLPLIYRRKEPITNTALGPIHLATLRGFSDTIRLYLDSGKVDINVVTGQNRTALHIAVENGFSNVVQDLLKLSSLNPSAVDVDGWSPLHVAARVGNSEVARLLLDAGADLLAVTPRGETALHIAIAYDHEDVFSYLFAYSLANPKTHEKLVSLEANGSWTLLHEAAVRLNFDVAKRLVASGASARTTHIYPANCMQEKYFVTGVDSAKRLSPLHILFKTIFTNSRILSTSSAETSLLEDFVRLLLESGANVGDRLPNGQTLLHIVAGSKSVPTSLIVVLLAHAGSDGTINATDAHGSTPLHYAVSRDARLSVEALLDGGADTSVRDRNGYNPLHIATLKGSTDIIELLLKRGMDPNARSGKGQTPLHLATISHNLAAISLLAELGADLNVTTPSLDDFPTAAALETRLEELKTATEVVAGWEEGLSYPPLDELEVDGNTPTTPLTTAEVHQNSFYCRKPDCGREFTDRQNRNRHERVTHAPEGQRRPLKCPVPGCDIRLTRSDNLRKHVRNKHRDYEVPEKPIKRRRTRSLHDNNDNEGASESDREGEGNVLPTEAGSVVRSTTEHKSGASSAFAVHRAPNGVACT